MNVLSKETVSGIEALKDFYLTGLKFDEKFSAKDCFKFLQTFEIAGIPVCYEENYASPGRFAQTINLCDEELKLLGFLKQTGSEIFDNNDWRELNLFYADIMKAVLPEVGAKLEKYTEKFNIRKISPTSGHKVNFKDYEGLNKRIIIFSEYGEFLAEPVEVFKKSGLDYLKFFNVKKNEFDIIPANVTEKIIVTDIEARGNKFPVTRTFRIYGRLKTNYRLRPNEKIVDINNEFFTVSNAEENETELFKRLLKYGENCEIVYPAHLKEKFAEFVKKIRDIQVAGDFSGGYCSE